jgi:hypothetical protein
LRRKTGKKEKIEDFSSIDPYKIKMGAGGGGEGEYVLQILHYIPWIQS